MANHVSLKAMAEDKSIDGVAKVTHFKVDPRIITIEQGFNVRSKLYGQMTPARRAYIDSLKAAKLAGAVFPPLDVRVEEGEVILVDGENRLLMDLGEAGPPVLVGAALAVLAMYVWQGTNWPLPKVNYVMTVAYLQPFLTAFFASAGITFIAFVLSVVAIRVPKQELGEALDTSSIGV